MRIDEALERFVMQLRANGRSEHTIGQYQRHVRLLGSWLGDVPVERVDADKLAVFLAGPAATARPDGTPKLATSVNALRTSLRCFFSYAHEVGLISTNPARLIRRARCGVPQPRGLSEDEQERLLEVLRREDGGRDHAMFALMLATGIRVGSAVALRVEDVDLDAGELWLQRSKGDRREKVLLGPGSCDHLRSYLEGRSEGHMFPGRDGGPIGVRQVNRRLKTWFRRAGVTRGGSAHSLRHSFAQGLYDRTGDLGLVQRALCHASVVSTLIYAKASDTALRVALS